MFDTNIKVNSLEKLQNYINYVKKFSKMKTDKKFQKYIQNKCLNVVKQMCVTLLPNAGSNDIGELTQLYIDNNNIREATDGFIIYNNLSVSTDTDGYNGIFSIALAFEYGTGIVGENHPKAHAWEYNVKKHTKGWIYYKNGEFHFTRGFEGFEIYKLSAEEINKQLKNWVLEYDENNGGASTL